MIVKNVVVIAMTLAALSACRTANNDSSSVKDDPAPVTEPGEGVTPEDGTTAVVPGMGILENKPLVTMIPADANPESDWEFSSGREYWLYSSRGRYMTFSTGKYHPYQNRSACDGLQDDASSACSVSPSKVAQECQRIASLTLKAIMADQPQEYKDLQETYGGRFSLFGWMNDGHSDGENSTRTWQGPFIWRGDRDGLQTGGRCPEDFKRLDGYLKWVSAVGTDGKCETPSLGQFLALLKSAKSCLEANNQPTDAAQE